MDRVRSQLQDLWDGQVSEDVARRQRAFERVLRQGQPSEADEGESVAEVEDAQGV